MNRIIPSDHLGPSVRGRASSQEAQQGNQIRDEMRRATRRRDAIVSSNRSGLSEGPAHPSFSYSYQGRESVGQEGADARPPRCAGRRRRRRSILRFAALQLGADAETIHAYAGRQQTVSEHQQRIGEYLRLRAFDAAAGERLARFLENEALRLERTASLLARARAWLRDEHVLAPADSVLRRAIGAARHKARDAADATHGRAPVGTDARRS